MKFHIIYNFAIINNNKKTHRIFDLRGQNLTSPFWLHNIYNILYKQNNKKYLEKVTFLVVVVVVVLLLFSIYMYLYIVYMFIFVFPM